MAVEFDPEDLTIGEIEEVETRTGKSLSELFTWKADSMPTGIQLRAIAYIVKRRTEPEFTWEEAGALKVSALTGVVNDAPKENGDGPTSS